MVRGLHIKYGGSMPFEEFVKSDLLKELVAERKVSKPVKK